MRYSVDMEARVVIGVTVEAENAEEARAKAEEIITDKAIVRLLDGAGPDDASAEIDEVDISGIYEEE